jgi:hypothetical protein
MNDSTRDSIIDDLLKKRPAGPDGVTLKYTEHDKYDYSTDRYRMLQIPDDPSYGYSSKVLFQLSLRDRGDVEKYVRGRFFPDGYLGRKQSTVTRRTNRIWARINSPVAEITGAGGVGIYEVKTSRYTREVVAYVHALNAAEAQTLADLFLPKRDAHSEFSTRFIEYGNADKLRAHNDKIRAANAKLVEAYKQSIASAEKKIENLTNLSTTLEILENHQIALEA